MVIRPTGYAIWERIQAELDSRIKAAGVENAYFPLFLPQSYLAREAEHVEGFSPELAVVTHAGGKQLDEGVVVRPTSETIIGEYMAKWVNSYRDLPLLLNQWSNVVRWEMRPRVFLRTSEFLWQEGHTAHRTQQEASAFAQRIHREVYEDFMTQVLAIPVLRGRKTVAERFAGAVNTLTLEAMMRDGKALQMGTSHELGQNFARAFNIVFLSDQGQQEHAWTTSWGTSTRMIGALIMSHGDDAGLRLPPRLAPVQALVLIVKEGEGVREAASQLADELRRTGIRAKVDDRAELPFGRRAVDAELKGIPLRFEVGPREVADGNVTMVRRIMGGKEVVALDQAAALAAEALIVDHQALYDEAEVRLDLRTEDVESIEAAIAAAQTGLARIPWAKLGVDGERQLAQSGVTVRCLIHDDGEPATSDDDPEAFAVVGRAY